MWRPQTSGRRDAVRAFLAGGTPSAPSITRRPSAIARLQSRRIEALAVAVGLLAGISGPVGAADPGESERLHERALVVDGHNDIATWILDVGFDLGFDGSHPSKRTTESLWIWDWLLPTPAPETLGTHTDLARMEAGGLDAQFFSIWPHPSHSRVPNGATRRAIEMIDALERQFALHRERIVLVQTARELREATSRGKIAALLGLEGGHAISGQLKNLRAFRERGVRYMTLTWSNTNEWADAVGDEPGHGGLSEFGRRVVREMNRLGILVDVSHSADSTFWDAIDSSKAPVIASHSSARALVDNPRNLSDEMIRAIARSGGVVMVNFGGSFIDERKSTKWAVVADALRSWGPSPVPLSNLIDHIQHVATIGGIDSVGLGSDFDGTLFLPAELSDTSGFPRITEALLARGLSHEEIEKVLGGNILRVLEAAENMADALRD